MSFQEGLGVHSRKREGEDRKPEARPTPSRREVGGSAYKNKILKIPQTGRSPGVFLARKDKNIGKKGVHKNKPGVDKSISEGVLTTSFGAGRGGSVKKNILKPPQTGDIPGNFFARQEKSI